MRATPARAAGSASRPDRHADRLFTENPPLPSSQARASSHFLKAWFHLPFPLVIQASVPPSGFSCSQLAETVVAKASERVHVVRRRGPLAASFPRFIFRQRPGSGGLWAPNPLSLPSRLFSALQAPAHNTLPKGPSSTFSFPPRGVHPRPLPSRHGGNSQAWTSIQSDFSHLSDSRPGTFLRASGAPESKPESFSVPDKSRRPPFCGVACSPSLRGTQSPPSPPHVLSAPTAGPAFHRRGVSPPVPVAPSALSPPTRPPATAQRPFLRPRFRSIAPH